MGTNDGVTVGLVGLAVVGAGVGSLVRGNKVGEIEGSTEGRKVYLDGGGVGGVVGFKVGEDGSEGKFADIIGSKAVSVISTPRESFISSMEERNIRKTSFFHIFMDVLATMVGLSLPANEVEIGEMGCSSSRNAGDSPPLEIVLSEGDVANNETNGIKDQKHDDMKSKSEETPKKPPKPIQRKKSSGNVNGSTKNHQSRYMQINQPVSKQLILPNSRPHSKSSPVIPSSSYIGHLSRPNHSHTEDSIQIADGRTPSTNNETDPELLCSIRASAAQKRAATKLAK